MPSIRRIRHHVNPLTDAQRRPIPIPDWSEIYPDLSRPFWIDLGSAAGEFLIQMGDTDPSWNYLGLEIRKPMVDIALQRRDAAGVRNVHFMYANILFHLDDVLASLPAGSVRRVTVLFPDPHLKRRKHKWRQLQPSVLGVLACHLPPGAELHFATDVPQLYCDTTELLADQPAFRLVSRPVVNPFPVDSDREKHSRRLGRPVYRAVYVRVNDSPAEN